MAVSEISNAANTTVQRPPTAKTAAPATPATNSSPVPAATVEISHQALTAAAASSTVAAASIASSTASTPAPKVNNVKIANKESNEPLTLLTMQAKHGDPVARLLLKQINAKEAAKAADTSKPVGVAATDEDSETQETSEDSESSETAETFNPSEAPKSGATAEAGKGELVDQHA